MASVSRPTRLDVLVGRFELRSVLGRGGMSTVWSARDLLLGRDVAIKLLRDDLSEEHTGRIEREARAAARIMDPRIVTVLDLHQTDEGRPFLVLEPLTGRTLADELDGGALDAGRADRLADDLLGAIDAAHACGVLHRDIKPANVLVDGAGFRVTDFGIASVEDETATDGALVGTLRYIAPERFDGEPARRAGDVFSAAAVLYEGYSGEHPFAADDGPAVIGRMRGGPIGSPDHDLPPRVRNALVAALDTDPARRPSAAQLLASLRDTDLGIGHIVPADPDPDLDHTDPDRTAQLVPDGGNVTEPLDATASFAGDDTATMPRPVRVHGRTHDRDATSSRADAVDRALTKAAERLDHLAAYRDHPRVQAVRHRLGISHWLVLLVGAVLVLVLLFLIAGDDGTADPARPTDGSGDDPEPAAQLDDHLDRLEELG